MSYNNNTYNPMQTQNPLIGRLPTVNQQPNIGGSFMTSSNDQYQQNQQNQSYGQGHEGRSQYDDHRQMETRGGNVNQYQHPFEKNTMSQHPPNYQYQNPNNQYQNDRDQYQNTSNGQMNPRDQNSRDQNPRDQHQGQPYDRLLTEALSPRDKRIVQLKEYLTKNHTDLEKVFPKFQTLPGGVKVVDKKEFNNFLTSKLSYKQNDCEEFCKIYESHPGSGKINLVSLVQDLTSGPQGSTIMTMDKAQNLINQVYDGIKKYISLYGGNILQRFREHDYQRDGVMSKDELNHALMKLGFEKVENNQLDAVFFIYDPQNRGEFPYSPFLNKFYETANQKQVKSESDWSFPVFEQIRRYLKQYKVTLAQQFATDLSSALQKKEYYIESYGFFERLRFMGVKTDAKMEQRLLNKLDPGLNHKIDYLLFTDMVGHEKPEDYQQEQTQNQPAFGQTQQIKSSIIRDYRKYFYRTFCRHLKVRGIQLKMVEQAIGSQDVQNQQVLIITSFTNQVLSLCHGSELLYQRDVIESVGKDFDNSNSNQVYYMNFLDKLKYEYEKLSLLEQFYQSMKESLDFKATQNLYEILSMFDSRRDKKFAKDEIQRILRSRNISFSDLEIGYFFDEYDSKNTGSIDYYDIEKDFLDFNQWTQQHRPQSRMQGSDNLPSILRKIKLYSDQTGKSLREICKKTKVGDTDEISKFDFSRIMTEITYQQIDSTAIDQLTQELDIMGNNMVSFTELMKRYNEEFRIKEDPFESKFNEKFIELLYWDIAEKVVNKGGKFTLESHFELPGSTYQRFISDLEKDPLLCHKTYTKQQLDQVSQIYKRGSYIDTQGFLADINDKVHKIRLRNQTFVSLKKQLQFRGSKIQDIFKNIKGLGKYKDENLAPEEFLAVFMSIEFNIDLNQIRQILETFQQDSEGKVSYLEFITKYDEISTQKDGPQARRFFTSINDILEAIGKAIVKRNLKSVGSLLAGYDIKQNGKITRDAFYRTLDSMKLGLGEGDIQELIKTYDPLKQDQIDISHFADDLNRSINEPSLKINLNSLISQTVGERIVEPSTPSPRSKLKGKNQKENKMLTDITKDIVCGLFVKQRDPLSWFNEYARVSPGVLTTNEFFASIDALEVMGSLSDKKIYVADLQQLQEQYNGYKQQSLLTEFLIKTIKRECSYTIEQMTSEILFDIAKQLTASKICVRDEFQVFDKESNGFVFRNEFSGNILDNYLRLQSILSLNKINLLLLKFDPNQSFRVYYEDFISELKKIEYEHPREIKIFLTHQEMEEAKKEAQHQNEWDNDNIHHSQGRSKEPEPEANTKKNTVETELSASKSMQVQIPAIQFEDIMITTYKRGVAVEVYFKQFSKFQQGKYMIEKQEFSEALKKLGLKWADQHKVSELFDALDIASHGQYTRLISTSDIGIAVLQNASLNIQDYQGRVVESIHKELKAQNLLPKLRDILLFFNNKRDNTCASTDFKSTLLQKLDMKKNIVESEIDILIMRYKTSQDATRIDFTKFLKDIELVAKGISPVMMWATEFAEDFMKALVINDFGNMSQFFSKFSKLQGILWFEEFKRAMDELQLTLYHDESEQKDFFNHVDMQNAKTFTASGSMGKASKVGITQLINTIEKLCQKNVQVLWQEILEKIYGESKKLNITQTVYQVFNEFDPKKLGVVSFQDFKYALEQKLNSKDLKHLDIQFLANKYKPTSKGVPAGSVQYDKFLQDYEKIDKLGLRAGQDPLKEKAPQQQQLLQQNVTQQQLQMPDAVKKLYKDMGGYMEKLNNVEAFCEDLTRRDIKKHGFLSEKEITESCRTNKMKLSTAQMSSLLHVLPYEKVENSYQYMIMIELLFGKQKADEVQHKYHIQAVGQGPNPSLLAGSNSQLQMRNLFKDQVQLKLHTLQALAHQISKASWQLSENDFYNLFKRAQISLTSADIELLQLAFRQLQNHQSKAIDFNSFIKHFEISEQISILFQDLQKEIITHKIKVSESIKPAEINFGEFKQFIQDQKIKLNRIDDHKLYNLFSILAEGREKLEKRQFLRYLGLSDEAKEELIPYIANELIYYILNNKSDLYKLINPSAVKISRAQLDQIITQIKFKPTDPKELPSLYQFFAHEGDSQQISLQKLVNSVRKVDPSYGSKSINTEESKGSQGSQGSLKNVKAAQVTLVQFTPKIRQILQKMNDHFKKNNINIKQLHTLIDKNKNSLLDKEEMIQFFTQEMPIQGVGTGEYEMLYDALDMNRDGFLSINEFCLYLEGTKLTQDQRLKIFDVELEKDLKAEIMKLFAFFDKNGDGKISVEEVLAAMRSVNQNVGMKEAKDMINQVDSNKNGFIEKEEFIQVLLPKLKEEMLMYENNLEDLRRMFKEADIDHSGYLNKKELQQALLKIGVELSEIQIEDLIKELDLDENAAIDIDEFIAFLSIADQLKFKNSQSRSILINIRRARKVHPIDFYNSFKNLPQFFSPSFTQDRLEKKNDNTPSKGLHPEFDYKTMTYKDLNKMNDIQKTSQKQYIDMYGAGLGCEIQFEEATGIPLPKNEDFDWSRITHREVRAVLFDFSTKEFLSNSFIIQANWKKEYETKWLFNLNQSHQQARSFYLRTDLLKKVNQNDVTRDIHMLFELVIYTKQQDISQQVSCVWGSIPLISLDKAAKQKISLRGGSPMLEMQITGEDIHQSKKGFAFLKKTVATVQEAHLIINVKPQAKFQEQTQYCLAMLPSTCLIPKRLLTFGVVFRMYCYKKLIKAQQQMIAPQGNFVIAQFSKIFDNPDVNYILGECWEMEAIQVGSQIKFDELQQKMENIIAKLYSVIYDPQFKFDHIYPTRSLPIESELFLKREIMIKQAILTNKLKVPKQIATKPKEGEQAKLQYEEYRPFNISEMEIQISGINGVNQKQDELLRMYQQMGLMS